VLQSPFVTCRPHTAPPDLSTAQPPSTRSVRLSPVLCIRSPTLPRSSSLHAMPHLPPAHHNTSKHDSPNETKVKEKQNKTVPDSNSNLVKSMTHHNQTKKLITWFLKNVLKVKLYYNLSFKFDYRVFSGR
jgi:hypothetical protein